MTNQDENEHMEPQVTVCFLFVGLAIGCVTTYILSRQAPNIPYAVVVFISGILCAIGAMLSNFYVLGDSIFQWMDIEPHLLLYIFLPALIFGDAMGLNIHHMKCTFWSGILMGIPGSIVGTSVLAAFSKYCLPFGWSWGLCLVFGAILSATDTVSVFALLKQSGAPPRLTSLIVQESLYNDGAALVLFNIFFSRLIINSQISFTAEYIFWYCVRVLVLSPLLGISLGLLTVFGLGLANRKTSSDDVTIQVAVTMCCAYLSFFVAEYVMNVSGVLACCTAGITLAWLGPPLILQHETMHNVWSMLEWIGNTLIFLIAGLLFVIKTQQGVTTYFNFTGTDFALTFVIYFAVIGSRAVMIFVCYPFMSTSYGSVVTVKECVFLAWCGVRGAVGIVLALVLDESAYLGKLGIPHLDAHRAFFLVGGVATLTLVLNATMAKRLLFALGLVEETSEEIQMMQHYARSRIHRRVNELAKQLKKDLPPFDIYLVAEYCKVVAVNSMHPGSTRGQRQRGGRLDGKASSPPVSRQTSDNTVREGQGLLAKRSRVQTTAGGGDRRPPRAGMSEGAEVMVRILSSGSEDEEDCRSEGGGTANNDCTSVYSLPPGISRRNTSDVPLDLSMLRPPGIAAPQTDMDWSSSAIFSTKTNISKLLRSVTQLIDPAPTANARLLIHVRLAFLGVVRMVYWKLIDEGKLPRNSAAALALLYSVDFAQDGANTALGLRDWDALQPALTYTLPGMRILNVLAMMMDCVVGLAYPCSRFRREKEPMSSLNDSRSDDGTVSSVASDGRKVNSKATSGYFSSLVSVRADFRREENSVYMLTSFIEAHEHAQKMTAFYLGEDEVTPDTMEQVKVLEESTEKVKAAKKCLAEIDQETVSYSVSRQVARILLHAQVEMVEQLQKEGILRARDAGDLLQETQRDYQRMEGEALRGIWNNVLGWSEAHGVQGRNRNAVMDDSGRAN